MTCLHHLKIPSLAHTASTLPKVVLEQPTSQKTAVGRPAFFDLDIKTYWRDNFNLYKLWLAIEDPTSAPEKIIEHLLTCVDKGHNTSCTAYFLTLLGRQTIPYLQQKILTDSKLKKEQVALLLKTLSYLLPSHDWKVFLEQALENHFQRRGSNLNSEKIIILENHYFDLARQQPLACAEQILTWCQQHVLTSRALLELEVPVTKEVYGRHQDFCDSLSFYSPVDTAKFLNNLTDPELRNEKLKQHYQEFPESNIFLIWLNSQPPAVDLVQHENEILTCLAEHETKIQEQAWQHLLTTLTNPQQKALVQKMVALLLQKPVIKNDEKAANVYHLFSLLAETKVYDGRRVLNEFVKNPQIDDKIKPACRAAAALLLHQEGDVAAATSYGNTFILNVERGVNRSPIPQADQIVRRLKEAKLKINQIDDNYVNREWYPQMFACWVAQENYERIEKLIESVRLKNDEDEIWRLVVPLAATRKKTFEALCRQLSPQNDGLLGELTAVDWRQYPAQREILAQKMLSFYKKNLLELLDNRDFQFCFKKIASKTEAREIMKIAQTFFDSDKQTSVRTKEKILLLLAELKETTRNK